MDTFETVLLGNDDLPVVAMDRTEWDRIANAGKAILDRYDYLRNLWGDEGLSHSLFEALRQALDAVDLDLTPR